MLKNLRVRLSARLRLNLPLLEIKYSLINDIPDLTFVELLDGLRRMCNGRSSDFFRYFG